MDHLDSSVPLMAALIGTAAGKGQISQPPSISRRPPVKQSSDIVSQVDRGDEGFGTCNQCVPKDAV